MIVSLPFNEADWQRAERLLDCCYWLAGKKLDYHLLLVADSAIHAEFKTKVKIAAEVAFQSVELIEAVVAPDAAKTVAINTAFRTACQYISQSYRHPWLWLEADCVPLAAGWLKELFRIYDKQPKRFMGRHLKANSGTFMSRVGVYPQNAYRDLEGALKGAPPFERVANILPGCQNTQLIHMEKWTAASNIPSAAVLLNGDRTGALIENVIEGAQPKKRAA